MAVDIFFEIGLVVLLAAVVSIFMNILKQPLIVGYIFTGIIAGPVFLNIVQSQDILIALSQIGISFLLFSVGLSLNFREFKDVGIVSFLTGMGQILFTGIAGFVVLKLFGFTNLQAIYVAIALTFSSTIIVVKLLSDKRDLQSLYGRLSIGFMLVQDFAAVLAILFLGSFIGQPNVLGLVGLTLLKGVGLVLALFLLAKFVLPTITNYVARNQELLFIFSIAWVLILAIGLAAIGFSVEIGALFAGIALSMTDYHYEIASRIKPLRDFFLMLFFISLGMQMVFSSALNFLIPGVILALLVLLGNPAVVITILHFFKYSKRTSFLSGLSVAQIGEFSLIIAFLGLKLGHLSMEIVSMITIIAIITMSATSYSIMYGDKIYRYWSKLLARFERKHVREHEYSRHKGLECYPILLFGFGRIGRIIHSSLREQEQRVLVIEFNPRVVRECIKEKIDVKYGDADDYELLDSLCWEEAKLLVSTIPDFEPNELLIEQAKHKNPKTQVVVTAHSISDALEFYKAGAAYVMIPHMLGGELAARHISEIFKKGKLTENLRKLKKKQIENLFKKQKVGFDKALMHSKFVRMRQ